MDFGLRASVHGYRTIGDFVKCQILTLVLVVVTQAGCAERSPRERGGGPSWSGGNRDAAGGAAVKAGEQDRKSAALVVTPGAPIALNAGAVEGTEPWEFNGTAGQLIRTANYRIFTTEPPGSMTQRLPAFLEAALQHYRTTLTGPGKPSLLPPPAKMETYILSSRSDWETLARQVLGSQAEPFLKIQRGGFAYGGRALLFDLGTFDTFAVTAHEGWHQYTQRTFEDSLPVWLEEGIATLMEGHRWAGRGAEVRFLPWANVERFDQLRRASARNQLMSLSELLSAQPAQLIAGGSNDPGLTYYAQVWALSHFLMEGEAGKYREGLLRAVLDAQSGNLQNTVRQALGARAGGQLAMRRGPTVFQTYFNRELQEADAEYRAFIELLVKPGARGPVVQGVSPMASGGPVGGPGGTPAGGAAGGSGGGK